MNDTLADQLAPALPELPEGDYAIVEIMGHRTLVGMIEEITRFGSALLQITPILRGQFIGPVLVNGGSIYQLTPCTKEQALKHAPSEDWELPTPVRAALPTALIGKLEREEDDTVDAPFEPAFIDQGAR